MVIYSVGHCTNRSNAVYKIAHLVYELALSFSLNRKYNMQFYFFHEYVFDDSGDDNLRLGPSGF